MAMPARTAGPLPDPQSGRRAAVRRGVAGLLLLGAAAVIGGCSSPPQTPVVTITAAGDYGASDRAAEVLALAEGLRPDVHMALGDLSYAEVAPEQAWCAFVDAATGGSLRLALLAGNHDSADSADGRIEEFRRCLPNRLPSAVGDYGREYTIDLPAEAPLVRIVAASPNLTFDDGRWEYRPDDRHGRWLVEAIRGAREDGIDWIVVAAHVPCLSAGVHACPDPRDFTDTVLSEGVDVVLHGHEHSYARTHQLAVDLDDCPRLIVNGFDAACVADDDGEFAAGAGTVFATIGTGGTALREIPADDPELAYFGALSGSNRQPSHGVLQLRVTPAEIAGQFFSTQADGFRDSFTISRAR